MPVHLRLNDKDTSRNPYINFVTALPGSRQEEALRRLQQLAAMVKPLMKDQGFHINSLEEFEHNQEFAGRCWNNGEVIELVLTIANGSWMPLQYVLYVFCHELAHIKHMNHIPSLHGALTRHLKELALAKQREGYHGDGLWSSGRQLEDGGFVSGLGMNGTRQDLLPERVCGGAYRRRRAQSRGRRGQRSGKSGGLKFKGPSLHTGAQTLSNTKGGNRRVKLEVQESNGNRVDGKDWFPAASAKSKDYKLDDNSTFRKRTQSKDAREKRAAAALARFAALRPPTSSVKLEQVKREVKDEEGEEDSVTEDEDSGSDHTIDDGDDSWLVGNDLGESSGPKIKQEDVDNQFTQADPNETSDQRKRRMKRFDDKIRGSTFDDNNWQSLLQNNAAQIKAQQSAKTKYSTVGEKRVIVKQEDSDDVLLVEPPVKRLQFANGSINSSTKKSAPRIEERSEWGESTIASCFGMRDTHRNLSNDQNVSSAHCVIQKTFRDAWHVKLQEVNQRWEPRLE